MGNLFLQKATRLPDRFCGLARALRHVLKEDLQVEERLDQKISRSKSFTFIFEIKKSDQEVKLFHSVDECVSR